MKRRIIILISEGKGKFEEKDLPIPLKERILKLIEEEENRVSKTWKQLEEQHVKGSHKNLNKLISEYPELKVYQDYFSKIYQNNDYVIIMKYGIFQYMLSIRKYQPLMTYTAMGLVLNLSHSRISGYLKQPLESLHRDYNEVVLDMDKKIKLSLYPFTKPNSKTKLTDYYWKTIDI